MGLQKYFNIILAGKIIMGDIGIGNKGTIPWKAPTDLKFFKETTITAKKGLQNAVIMGRVTFDSIGRPLPGRINYVITRNEKLLNSSSAKVQYCPHLQYALDAAGKNPLVDKLFVIGGADIYQQAFTEWKDYIDTTYFTQVCTSNGCDRYIRESLITNTHYPPSIREHTEQNGTKLVFKEYHSINRGEEEYLNLMRRILIDGDPRKNRTGIDTISTFGERMVFDITNRIPFLTTKRLAWKTMLRELLWFISGDTNNKTLNAKGVHIWDGNSTREYLDSVGLKDRPEGDLGPVYGFQWRHFGAEYYDCRTDYTGKGVDQLANVVKLIKEDPTSRRIIMSAWNPLAQPEMALPPCHILAQWYVREGGYLDCQLYQRSCDVALGVPFNIASYSVLTYMLAHVCKLQPGKFIHILGDAHIYSNHIDGVKQQLERKPYQFPHLKFKREIDDIDDFKEDDFIVVDYKFHPTIKMTMAV